MDNFQQREIERDILIVGASAGGCAAALAAAEAGASVCLIEAGTWIGGQLTSQGVCTPDEQQHIETFGGTRRYSEFRNRVREHYRQTYQLSAKGAEQAYFNPGSCWVSRLSYEPKVGAAILRDMLRPFETSGRLQIWFETRVIACEMEADAPYTLAAVVAQSATGETLRFLPRYVLDATDMGDVLALCGQEGVDWTIGAESQTETGEPDAPPEPRPHWVQPFTFPFALEWSPETADTNIIEPPHDYAELKALQDYKILHGAITGLFAGRAPWWQYRRILANDNFDDPRIPRDVAMINTAGNDYYGGNILGPGAGDSAQIQATLARARRASRGYVYWLQTECEREERQGEEEIGRQGDKSTQLESEQAEVDSPYLPISPSPCLGYPEFRLRTDLFDTADGCAPEPYIRESRRIKALRPILEQEIVVKDFSGNVCRGENARAAWMPDSVGVGHYALDIHPNGHGEPNHYVATRPFQIPLGALIPVRLTNLLPACKNLGATHLTNGAYRLHPIEWNIGESAGLLAAFALRQNRSPRAVYEDKSARGEYQRMLLSNGIALSWHIDAPLSHPAFRAVQTLALQRETPGNSRDLLFRPDEPITPEDWQAWKQATGRNDAPATFTGTRAEAALALYGQK